MNKTRLLPMMTLCGLTSTLLRSKMSFSPWMCCGRRYYCRWRRRASCSLEDDSAERRYYNHQTAAERTADTFSL